MSKNSPESTKAWHEANPNYRKEKSAEFRLLNPGYNYAQVKKWRLNNPGVRREERARRRALELQALPKWLSAEALLKIREWYDLAKHFTQQFGPHHVDHIIPLRGKNVWGLHVPWNMQILPAALNIKKSNKVGL